MKQNDNNFLKVSEPNTILLLFKMQKSGASSHILTEEENVSETFVFDIRHLLKWLRFPLMIKIMK